MELKNYQRKAIEEKRASLEEEIEKWKESELIEHTIVSERTIKDLSGMFEKLKELLAEAEKTFEECKKVGRFTSIVNEIEYARRDKLEAVKKQSFETAASLRLIERNYLFLLHKMCGHNVSESLSDELANTLLSEFTEQELADSVYDEGYQKALLANKKLKRRPENYMNPLCRNWAQVKYSDYLNEVVEAGKMQLEASRKVRPRGVKDYIIAIINKKEIFPSQLTVPLNGISQEQFKQLHEVLDVYGIKALYSQLNGLSGAELDELYEKLKNL